MDEQQLHDADQRADPDQARASIDLTADADRVWQALVTDGGLEPWMGCGACIDAEIGGRLHLPDPVGGRPRQGRVEAVEDSSRLQFSWWPEDRPLQRSRVCIVLEPIPTGTRVTVTESHPRPASRSAQASGSLSGRGLVGAWSWRLALLVMACNPALV